MVDEVENQVQEFYVYCKCTIDFRIAVDLMMQLYVSRQMDVDYRPQLVDTKAVVDVNFFVAFLDLNKHFLYLFFLDYMYSVHPHTTRVSRIRSRPT